MKCPKTLSGEHEFRINNDARDINDQYIEYPICRFCGIIDDRKEE